MTGPFDSKDRDERDPSPYNSYWYEDAKRKGGYITDGLFGQKITPSLVLDILDLLYRTLPEGNGNPEANRAARDWSLEVLAGAQDRLIDYYHGNEGVLRHRTDYRKLAPRSQYQPPSEEPTRRRISELSLPRVLRESYEERSGIPSTQHNPPVGGDVA